MIKHIINIRKKQKPGEPTAAGVSGFFAWQGRRDSNTQPAVLETAALPLSHSPKREDNHSIAAGCCQSGKIRGSLLITVKCLLSDKGVARRVAPRAEYSRSGARGGRRSGTLDGIFHNWGRCTKTATTPGGPKTPATVAFSRSSQDLPLLCSDIAAETSLPMSEQFFGTFSTRRQPPAAVGLTRALQIFTKSGPTPNPEHSAHGARLGRISGPNS